MTIYRRKHTYHNWKSRNQSKHYHWRNKIHIKYNHIDDMRIKHVFQIASYHPLLHRLNRFNFFLLCNLVFAENFSLSLCFYFFIWFLTLLKKKKKYCVLHLVCMECMCIVSVCKCAYVCMCDCVFMLECVWVCVSVCLCVSVCVYTNLYVPTKPLILYHQGYDVKDNRQMLIILWLKVRRKTIAVR